VNIFSSITKKKERKNKKNFSSCQFIFIIFTLLFFLTKLPSFAFKFSDENLYFYDSYLLAENILPYRDFFFAHPPFQLLFLAFFVRLFYFSPILLKLLPILLNIFSAFFIFKISFKFLKSSKLSLLASFFYLFSFVILTTSDYSTGIHLANCLFLTSLYFLQVKKKPFFAGFLSFLALFTRFYIAIAIFAVILYLFLLPAGWRGKKTSFFKKDKYLLSFTLTTLSFFIFANLFLIFALGQEYLQPVFLYHLKKTTGIPKLHILTFFLRHDFLLIFLGLLNFIYFKKTNLLFYLLVVFYTIFYILFADIYYLYFVVFIFPLSILSAGIFQKLISSKKFLIPAFLVCLFIFFHNSYFYLTIHAQKAKIENLEKITAFISKNSAPNQTLFGNYEITPLLALLTKRKIISNLNDTNAKVFQISFLNQKKLEEKLAQKVKFIILKAVVANNQILKIEPNLSSDFLKTNCRLEKTHPIKNDYSANFLLIFDCQK